VVKAKRAGFRHLWVVYPFRDEPLRNSWVSEYITELGVEVEVISPENIGEKFREFLNSI